MFLYAKIHFYLFNFLRQTLKEKENKQFILYPQYKNVFDSALKLF